MGNHVGFLIFRTPRQNVSINQYKNKQNKTKPDDSFHAPGPKTTSEMHYFMSVKKNFVHILMEQNQRGNKEISL